MNRRYAASALYVLITACSGRPHATKFDFYSADRTNGIFFDGNNVSIGSVVSANGKPVEKGVEGKFELRRKEFASATCLVSPKFVLALPKASGLQQQKVSCGVVEFEVSSCRVEDACSGYVLRNTAPRSARAAPRWYSYDPSGGVKKISFDPRGISSNPLVLDGDQGPVASEK
jgi:hypothetical protein